MTDIKKVFKVAQSLQIGGDQSLLGTGADEIITVISDFDLQEAIEYKEGEKGVKLYKKILKFFQKVFKDALKNKKEYPVIPDFKCGVLSAGEPVRWNKEGIKKGYQMIDDRKVFFIDCLQEKSVVKIDYLAFLDGKYVEFSSNYYFNFGGSTTYNPITTEKIITSLLQDGKRKIYEEGKPLKGLKRIYSALKLTDIDRSKLEFLVEFLNSDTAEINKIVGDLELILDVINTDFRDVPLSIIKQNLRTLSKDASKESRKLFEGLLGLKDKKEIAEKTKELMKELMKSVNKETEKYIKKNKKRIDNLVLYGSKETNKKV